MKLLNVILQGGQIPRCFTVCQGLCGVAAEDSVRSASWTGRAFAGPFAEQVYARSAWAGSAEVYAYPAYAASAALACVQPVWRGAWERQASEQVYGMQEQAF